jgi:hypothetical protein
MEKAGRNDPCPCGSGKKFKKCCENQNKTKKIQATVLSSLNNSSAANDTSRVSRSFFQRVVQPKLSQSDDENKEKKEE